MPLQSTSRFSDRVDDYVKYRPTYPSAVLDVLQSVYGLTPDWVIVDIGAGTGISAQLFLDAGNHVIGVEPNEAMRHAAVQRFSSNPKFTAIPGTAEHTGLPSAVAHLVVAAQAFHWFDAEAVRVEWQRILHAGGLVSVIWNSRRTSGSAFLEGYESLLKKFGIDYHLVAERYSDETQMRAWFGAGFRHVHRFDNAQRLSFDGVKGRLLSSSYAPKPGHANYDAMMTELDELFANTATEGRVDFVYDTVVYVGSL